MLHFFLLFVSPTENGRVRTVPFLCVLERCIYLRKCNRTVALILIGWLKLYICTVTPPGGLKREVGLALKVDFEDEGDNKYFPNSCRNISSQAFWDGTKCLLTLWEAVFCMISDLDL